MRYRQGDAAAAAESVVSFRRVQLCPDAMPQASDQDARAFRRPNRSYLHQSGERRWQSSLPDGPIVELNDHAIRGINPHLR